MSIASPPGLPQFLRLLTTFPDADVVMTSMVTGPLAPFGVVSAQLWRLWEGDLVSIAMHGHRRDAVERYSVLPPTLNFAVWRAVRTGEPVITDAAPRAEGPIAAVDNAFRDEVLHRLSAEGVVRSAVAYGGESVGAIGLILDRPWVGTPEAAGVLAAVCSALGLWMTNPVSGTEARAAATATRYATGSFSFSARQRDILGMVDDGMSTAAIARTLHLSESTVKSELQQIMRVLNASNRREAATRARDLGLLQP